MRYARSVRGRPCFDGRISTQLGHWVTLKADARGLRWTVNQAKAVKASSGRPAGEASGLSERLGRNLCSQRIVLNGRKRIIEVMKQLLPALIFG